MSNSAPVATHERIAAIDIIRGFALFGVLWMNLQGHAGYVVPDDAYDKLATAPIDAWLGPLASWLMEQKAQALFSLLFGFGFANIMARLEARGADAGRLFRRRIAVLALFGAADAFMMWAGDILLPYAAMGFLLSFTRRWPSWALLAGGLFFAAMVRPLVGLWASATGWSPKGWVAVHEQGMALRYTMFQDNDYPAFVHELVRLFWTEWYSWPVVIGPFLAWILGRFLLGSWIYRQHWFDDPAAHRELFRRVALIGLPLGLVLAAVPMLKPLFDIGPPTLGRYFGTIGQLVLACGYGAGIVMLHLNGKFERLLSALADIGRMALTNYLMQSLFFVFVIYGFGLNLLPYLGPTLSLALAIGLFGVQLGFSRWWLRRYRFGPLEWLWRSLTYGERQPMRLAVA